MIRNFKL